ncbi:MAG TPA: YggT family protein [Rhodospirillaceae bacterium]|jgi:YggT family protein|nr:YggT family protein [Alphaproteobacteria bacterium]HBH25934.1 YggT family protein [Rhodospirillaceae bacterium]
MLILINLLDLLVGLLYLAIIAHWLISLGAVALDHPALGKFKAFMDRALAPLYGPIRRFIRPVNGFDLTPLVAVILVGLAWSVLSRILGLLV